MRCTFFSSLLLAGALANPVAAHNGALAIGAAVAGISVDGTLSDWPQSSPRYALARADWPGAYAGEADFQGFFRIGHDAQEQALYIAVEVADDSTLSSGETSSRRPLQDACEIVVAIDHGADGPPPDLHRIWGFGTGLYRLRPAAADGPRVELAVHRSGQKHIYEWRLALSPMQEGGAAPMANRVIGLNVSVYDIDEAGGGRGRRNATWMRWGPGRRGRNRLQGLGDLVLIGAGTALGQIQGHIAWADTQGRAPPEKIALRSQRLDLVLGTDAAGHYSATLPVGRYKLEVEDFRRLEPVVIQVELKSDTETVVPPLHPKRIFPAAYYRPLALEGSQGLHRGVNWVAGRSIDEYQMVPLVENGVNWIVQTPFGWQQRYNSTEIRLRPDGSSEDGESDQGIAATTQMARKFGIRTVLKPHIWLRDRSQGKWRGQIDMDDEEAWGAWLANYRTFILHYARLAQRLNIGILCIGTELHTPAVERPQDWRRLITAIRQVYGGKLVYAANWHGEFEEVEFWDELDFIGLQAYFPLTAAPDMAPGVQSTLISPTVEELKKSWQVHLPTIERVYKRYGKPILVTEFGYHSTVDATVRPWEWESSDWPVGYEVGLTTQANGYEAFFQTFSQQPWFAGVYIWKWYPQDHRVGGVFDKDFTPQNKPAEEVMRQWYSRFHREPQSK